MFSCKDSQEIKMGSLIKDICHYLFSYCFYLPPTSVTAVPCTYTSSHVVFFGGHFCELSIRAWPRQLPFLLHSDMHREKLDTWAKMDAVVRFSVFRTWIRNLCSGDLLHFHLGRCNGVYYAAEFLSSGKPEWLQISQSLLCLNADNTRRKQQIRRKGSHEKAKVSVSWSISLTTDLSKKKKKRSVFHK